MTLTRRELLAIAGAATTLSAQTPPVWQVALGAWKGVRPRLLLNAPKLATIRSGLNSTYKTMWNRVPGQIGIIRSQPPPPFTSTGVATDQQLWQRDNGDSMIYLAFAYLISGDATYLADCKTWALASCSYPTWGTGSALNNELAAAHQLFGLAVVYDWLQGVLDPTTLATIRQTLITRAPAMYSAAADPKVYWSTRVINGHTTIHITGLAAAGFALFDDAAAGTQALSWLDRCRTTMQQMQSLYNPDGASLEGITYWDYGIEYALKFWDLSESLLGEKTTSGYFNQTPWYRIYLTAPYNALNFQKPVQADLADCARGVWYGPSPHMRKLASVGKNGVAQWYADGMASLGIDRYLDAWLNFIWFDPSIAAQRPVGMATLRFFDDMGIVSARSDWSGNESLVVFKSGAPAGLLAQQQLKTDTGDASHAHPDANHFTLFANGQFLVRDDGYLEVKKTENHNTLLVGGKGQMGEGGQWLVLTPYLNAKAVPRIITAQQGSSFDYIVGEAAPAYDSGQGVNQFRRHLLFLKPNALLVFDDIQLKQAAAMELRFHPENAPVAAGAGVFLSQGASAVLRTELLTPGAVDVTIGTDIVQPNGAAELKLSSIRLRRNATSWRNVTAFSWDAQTPQQISVEATNVGYTVSAGARRITFQWDGTAPSELTAVPIIRAAQPVLPAFGGNAALGFATNGYVEIYGDNLANNTATWSGADFSGANAPQALSGTQVRVNGIPAFVYFVSPHQVNVNVPETALGPVELQVFNNGVPSNIVTINRVAAAPALLTTPLFQVAGKRYVVAFLPESTQNGPFVGQSGLIPGLPFQPVRAGDYIVLYVLGAGPTNPATQPGVIAASNAKVASSYTLLIGGQPATVDFFGIVAGSVGLYQMNAVIPSTDLGDQPIELTVAGVKDGQGLYLSGVQA